MTAFPAGTFGPRPAASSVARMVPAQAWFEMRLLLRHPEQLLLVLVIPLGLLSLLATVPIVDTGPGTVDFLVPGILALAVMSTAFTGQAIATGFERRYGALKWLGSTALPRWGLLAAKTLAVLAVEVLQVGLLAGAGLALGWRPTGSAWAVGLLLLVGTAAFSALGLLMAGTLRAEATLAAANLVYVLLLLTGGVVVPLERYPDAVRPVLELSPTAALADGLRTLLIAGAWPPGDLLVLACWAGAAAVAAARLFRWQ